MKVSCPTCGAELSRDSSVEGLCPCCLVELAVKPDALEDPGTPSRVDSTGRLTAAGLQTARVLGGRYRIRHLLGHGGMGEVWWAVDLKLRTDVALKALRPELLDDDEALQALRAEVRMARQVVSANVCRVFDLVEVDGRELLSMELVNGVTLRRLLEERGPLDLAEATRMAAQLLAGLGAIHDAGLVHRDVKPENVMVTRSGRVVLMDFGIAKSRVDRVDGRISGTPAFMAPEQRRGEPPTAASDVFSAGVVLAEMVAPSGTTGLQARRAVWEGVHRDPQEVADTPWRPVILTAVARDPSQRFSTASELARALDEVALRSRFADEARPYPGLAAFTAEDAGYFFGRELEVEELWRKLRRPHLMGLIGPSGAGKSSFLRAGLLPAVPPGWRAVVAVPGRRPVRGLARALLPELADDAGALRLLVHADETSVLEAVRCWRRRHDHVLVVVDQFEELFTLNPPEAQERMSQLLARLVVEADARVLLSMRDDFLFRCADRPALAPVFSELTPLSQLPRSALRRALIQPALTCGYRFADDDLVDEMIGEVEEERGALPLLAFAAARLWEFRDREHGTLTRAAYEHVGGVGGALARHAEATLDGIGSEGVPLVREILRNLVTAQGTRAARSRRDLLSVFAPDGQSPGSTTADQVGAERVLDALVDARLLTTYEVAGDDEGDPPRQMVEIIHESLLAAWPRLVRWQTQDQEGALLRDQVRQAARMWDERGRPDDLLWTGTSYQELILWRERYGGGLTTVEEEFVAATTAHARAGRRRRRRVRAVVAASLLVGLVVVAGLWWRAQRHGLRAESSHLLSLGQLAVEDDPTGALALALASLERADDPAIRQLVVEAFQRGPPALYLEGAPNTGRYQMGEIHPQSVDFAADGRRLAAGYTDGRVKVWSSSGGEPSVLTVDASSTVHVRFGPTSDVLYSRTYPAHTIEAWSVEEGRRLWSLPVEGPLDFRLALEARRLFTFRKAGSVVQVESWPLDGGGSTGGPVIEGALHEWSKYSNPWNIEVDPFGRRLAYSPYGRDVSASGEDARLYVVDIGSDPHGELPWLVGSHAEKVGGLTFDHRGLRLAAADNDGEVRIWSLTGAGPQPERTLHHPPGLVRHLRFSPDGTRLVATSFSGQTSLWSLDDPRGARPLEITLHDTNSEAVFHPRGDWLATAGGFNVAIRPLGRRFPVELTGHDSEVREVLFTPGGRELVSISLDGTIRLWPLSAGGADRDRVVFDAGEWVDRLAIAPSGRQVLVATVAGEVWWVPLAGQDEPRMLEDLDHRGFDLVVGDEIAVASGGRRELRSAIRVWDLETNRGRTIETGRPEIFDMVLAPDGRLIAADLEGIRIWDLDTETEVTIAQEPSILSASRDCRRLLIGGQGSDAAATLVDLEDGTTTVLEGRGPSVGGRLDAAGEVAVTIPASPGPVRVGMVDGGQIHLMSVADHVHWYALSPDGRWLATLSVDDPTIIRLHPVPDLTRPALHALPRHQLVATLRRLTNLRARLDPASDRGWRWELDPFPGWEEVPRW